MKFCHRSFLLSIAGTKLVASLSIIVIIGSLIAVSVPFLEAYLVINKPLQHADALVLMAGEVPTRLPAAARLYKEGRADKILLTNDGILSAWSEKHKRNLFQVEWAEILLLEEKLPKRAIVKLPYTSSGTIYDALSAKSYILNHRIDNILVVTSDYHTRRSLWVFQNVFRGHPVTIGVYPVRSKSATSPFIDRLIIVFFEASKLIYYKCWYVFPSQLPEGL